MVKKTKSGFKVLALVTVLSLSAMVFMITFITQRIRLTALNMQMEGLSRELEELALEEQRLELLMSYVQTAQFADDYARNKLGYVQQNEIVFRSEK